MEVIGAANPNLMTGAQAFRDLWGRPRARRSIRPCGEGSLPHHARNCERAEACRILLEGSAREKP